MNDFFFAFYLIYFGNLYKSALQKYHWSCYSHPLTNCIFLSTCLHPAGRTWLSAVGKGRTLQCTLYTSDKQDEFSQQDSVAVRGVSGGK